MKKHTFYTEFAYFFGILILALGTAFMEAADFGVSMIVAPAYLLHLKLSQVLPFFTFGMAEYTLQAVLLLLLIAVLRRFKVSYLFSFVTAVIYGLVLDLNMAAVSLIPCETIPVRVIFYIVGMILGSIGVSLFFHTYISPEVYELFVKEASAKYGVDIHKFKTAYDCVSCAAAIVMSFCFFGFGHFEGVKAGTILCALVNGWIIGQCTRILEAKFAFTDRLRLRGFFEK
jgi:uncharacterized membrane protein YczE